VIFTIKQTKQRSGWPVSKTLNVMGISSSNYYRWCSEISNGSLIDNRGRTPSLDRTLPEEEQRLIAYALRHPQEGYRRLAWMMVDEDVVYLCPSTVYRILDKNDLLYRWKRSSSVGIRPTKAQRPDERWHTDILYLWVMNRWYFLVTLLDAFSRFIVHWKLLFWMSADDVVDVIEEALEKTPGAQPQIVSDNGPQFVAKEFRKLIKRHTLVEIKIRRQHPESNGLIERYHRSLREEGFGEQAPSDYYQACDLIENWVEYYNNRRLHSAIQYLRPIDYYRGEPEKLIKERIAKLNRARKLRRQLNKERFKKAA
jgi:transposase InsO family protein